MVPRTILEPDRTYTSKLSHQQIVGGGNRARGSVLSLDVHTFSVIQQQRRGLSGGRASSGSTRHLIFCTCGAEEAAPHTRTRSRLRSRVGLTQDAKYVAARVVAPSLHSLAGYKSRKLRSSLCLEGIQRKPRPNKPSQMKCRNASWHGRGCCQGSEVVVKEGDLLSSLGPEG